MKLPVNWIKNLKKRGWMILSESGLEIEKRDEEGRTIARIVMDYDVATEYGIPGRMWSYVITSYCIVGEKIVENQPTFRVYHRAQRWFWKLAKEYDEMLDRGECNA